MKILIIGFSKIKYMPYANFYLENIDKKNNDVHLLYWNRDLQEEDCSPLLDVRLHELRCKQDDDASKILKIGNFIRFKKFAQKVIKQERFDFVIALHSMPGVLIYSSLQKKYANRYIFDYRDSTYERFGPFKRIIGKIVKRSAATFVSSDAFRKFLPMDCQEKVFTSHNLLMDSLEHRDEKVKYGIESNRIRIAFWGFIRHENINREMIKKIAADARFELHYYGREQQIALNLKQYSNEIGADNVFFHGEYKPADRYEFVRNTDIIHNVYQDANMSLAMANKYYDAAIFYIPLMSMQGAFMAERAKKAGIGFSVDPYDEHFTDSLFDQYKAIEKNEFAKKCDQELESVLAEYRAGSELICRLTSTNYKE